MHAMSAPDASRPLDSNNHWRSLRELTFNVLLSLLFLQFAALQFGSLMDAMRLSTLLLLIKVSTDVVFYLIRRIPKDVSPDPYDWFVALAGTYAILFFRPFEQGRDVLIGQILQFAGIGLQIAAMLSLNRSIGMVAANRGIQTGGLYRFVRHPLYLSYIVAFLGYAINHPSAYNIGVYLAAMLLWVLRLLAEERFLFRDDGYRAYAQRVRYRMLPGIF
jgi:protein-S-isoprenylcysteine O-methyltransferase Ste14